ncbi:MAG: Lrp/AsnC family transcriptional regulator [Candidatus Micrarchaeota archaeon]|nr:Lrp/AsnC family transcriptional regulator [Candidatus Micrarchaeota archaeon]MDE1870500.1 Lrp/AsnC family transcriptional regulator [Candidatus Micrarchaeota archaeon]
MPANLKLQRYVREDLPYRLLKELYKNSRVSLRGLAKELGVSHHTVAKTLERLEEEYEVAYTLELNEAALGFSEGKLITIKFETMPEREKLVERFRKDTFIQDAYLCTGDFDAILYVVGLTPQDFQRWQFNLRVDLSQHNPVMKFSSVNDYIIGFFPLRNEIIQSSVVLSETEKRVLCLLNENSRIKLSDLIKKAKTTQMKVIYIMKKLEEKNIVKGFAALMQKSDKRIFLAYGTALNPVKNHPELALSFAKELIGENFQEATNDYVLNIDINGGYDTFSMCTFKDGENMAKRGVEMLRTCWAAEKPKIDKAILTDIIVGKWPFHLEEYESIRKFVGSSSK